MRQLYHLYSRSTTEFPRLTFDDLKDVLCVWRTSSVLWYLVHLMFDLGFTPVIVEQLFFLFENKLSRVFTEETKGTVFSLNRCTNQCNIDNK